jgi:branched-chain amino acid transport system permease protein
MSAADWRKAMNSGATSQAWPRALRARPSALTPRQDADGAGVPAGLSGIARVVRPIDVVVVAALVVYPWLVSPFFTFQIGAQSLALGLVALSLTFLAGYGGMVSLAQMTVAGIAGYAVAIVGASGTPQVSLGWPWWLAVLLALPIAVLAATVIGWLSVRTEGIYTIMITLAIGVAFYYLVLQNYAVFNGFQGFQRVLAPTLFGLFWGDAVPFYYLALFWALAGYAAVTWTVRTPFGIALQGIRDNPRRMAALGFHVTAHRVAAYALAGVLAGVGGVLMVWYNGLISPGSVGTGALINVLIVSVLGGLRHPVGAFVGAVAFVLLQNFAIDLFDRERFNLVIGTVFLLVVLFSPDGLLGWWSRLRRAAWRAASARGAGADHDAIGTSTRPRAPHSPTGG